MPRFSSNGDVPGQRESINKPALQKGGTPERLFADDSAVFAPPKEEVKVGISGFGRDTSDDFMTKGPAFRRRDEVNPYADTVREKGAVDHRLRTVIALFVLLIVSVPLVLILPYGLFDGARSLTIAEVVASVSRNVSNLVAFFVSPGSAGSEEAIVAKYLAIVVAGAALGVTGAVYQGSLRNSLASPSTLGVDVGASSGGTVYVLFFGGSLLGFQGTTTMSTVTNLLGQVDFPTYVMLVYGRAIGAIIGAFLVVALVVVITVVAGRGRINGAWLIITGTIVATFASLPVTLATQYFTEMGMSRELQKIEGMTAQSFTSIYTIVDVLILAIPVIICLVLIFSVRIKLGLLTFGDDEARSMGVNPLGMRVYAVAITTVMSAIVTAFCGNVSFLGFMVPHITRRFIGSDFRYLLPASAASGALVLLISYYLMSLWGAAAASYTGVLTSIIGFAVFAVMFVKQRGLRGSAQANEI